MVKEEVLKTHIDHKKKSKILLTMLHVYKKNEKKQESNHCIVDMQLLH